MLQCSGWVSLGELVLSLLCCVGSTTTLREKWTREPAREISTSAGKFNPGQASPTTSPCCLPVINRQLQQRTSNPPRDSHYAVPHPPGAAASQQATLLRQDIHHPLAAPPFPHASSSAERLHELHTRAHTRDFDRRRHRRRGSHRRRLVPPVAGRRAADALRPAQHDERTHAPGAEEAARLSVPHEDQDGAEDPAAEAPQGAEERRVVILGEWAAEDEKRAAPGGHDTIRCECIASRCGLRHGNLYRPCILCSNKRSNRLNASHETRGGSDVPCRATDGRARRWRTESQALTRQI